jgi:hypothetical protein
MEKQEIKTSAEQTDYSESGRIGNIFDAFTKRMFGNVAVFADFLVNYADPVFVAEIDLKKITPAPTHYFGKEGDERIMDLIFLCPLKNGTGTAAAVILFEHIGGSLKRVPEKLLRYISAIWDAETKADNKVHSAPYFIVLRTGRKPIRRKARMADSVAKTKDGKSVGRVPEVDYDVVDLPAYGIKELRGGAVLRLTMGILKKMAERLEVEFPEALLPLLEISNEEQKFTLLKEVLIFAGKVFAAHRISTDSTAVRQALEPIFRGKERLMMRTFIEKEFDKGVAVGKAEGKAEGLAAGKAETEARNILRILTRRIKPPSKSLQNKVNAVRDLQKLDELLDFALTCVTLEEFATALE